MRYTMERYCGPTIASNDKDMPDIQRCISLANPHAFYATQNNALKTIINIIIKMSRTICSSIRADFKTISENVKNMYTEGKS